MFRSRQLICIASIAIVSSMLAGHSLAQPPGPGGPGGGRGGRGGPGGPGGLLGLVTNPGVQTELKLQDPQKQKIETLSKQVSQQQQKIREQTFQGMNFGNRNNNNNNNNANPNGNGGPGQSNGAGGGFGGPGGGGPGAVNPMAAAMATRGYGMGWGGMGLGGYGGYGLGYGGMALGYGGFGMGWGGMGGGNPPGGNPNGGGRRQMDPEMAARFTAMREASAALQQKSEQELGRILTKPQGSRLKQIQLQLAGIGALLQPEMIEKLSLSEDQVAQIQELLNEGRQAARENGRQMFDLMRQAVPDTGNTNNAAPNGANGNNGPGGRGRRGPNMRDPAVQAALKNYMEKPETKAKMDQIQAQNQKIDRQLLSAVYRILSKRQGAAYKKMLGAPFDVAQMRGDAPASSNANQAATKAGAADAEDSPTAKPAPRTNSSAKSKRKSLREQRGLD